jgi:hypothetical protein
VLEGDRLNDIGDVDIGDVLKAVHGALESLLAERTKSW